MIMKRLLAFIVAFAVLLPAFASAQFLMPGERAKVRLRSSLSAGLAFETFNCSIAASVAGNNLTLALKNAAGNDPTSASPCTVNFRNATASNGTVVTRTIAAPSLLVLNAGSTLGTANNVPFRVYASLFDNGTTAVLGASVQSSSTTIYALDESILKNTTACNACASATSAGTFYTAAALTSRPWRLFGMLTWESGLPTAGNWASGPTTIQIVTPSTPRPGQVLQGVQPAVVTTQTSNATGTYVDSLCTATITPGSAANFVYTSWKGSMVIASAGDSGLLVMRRGGTVIGAGVSVGGYAAANAFSPVSGEWVDNPQTAGTVVYTVAFRMLIGSGGITFPHSVTGLGGCTVVAQEIMG